MTKTTCFVHVGNFDIGTATGEFRKPDKRQAQEQQHSHHDKLPHTCLIFAVAAEGTLKSYPDVLLP